MSIKMISTLPKINTTAFLLLLSVVVLLFSTQVSAQTGNVVSRLQAVEDNLAIQKLLGQYMSYVDAGEFEDYSMLFAEDGELIFQSFHLEGRKAIFELMNGGPKTDEPPATSGRILVHTMSNSLIEIDGDTATHTARWINMAPNTEGLPVMRATGLYQDLLHKVEGEWKIQRRVVTNDIPFVETSFSPD